MATEPRLEHQIFKVRQLVEDYRAGRIVIPEFQREYVWQRSKAPRLIDSLYRGFPISSLLLWQSADESRARRRDPRPVRSALYRQLRRNLDGSRHADRREARFEALRRILDYEIPVVRMVDHSFDDAVRAFTRINTLGVRLKKEDIESAQVAARHSGFVADEVTPFLNRVRQEGFNRLNVMHLFRACAFVARPDGRSRTPLHESERREVLAAWKTTEKATEQAIALIRSELGLVNMNILWSGALVVPLIALCATMPPRQRDSKELAGWLALAALYHRYSGSSETALDQDLRACRTPDPVGPC